MPATLVVLPETTCSSRSILVVLMALVVLLVAPVVLVVLALVLVPTTSAPRPLQVPPIGSWAPRFLQRGLLGSYDVGSSVPMGFTYVFPWDPLASLRFL